MIRWVCAKSGRTTKPGGCGFCAGDCQAHEQRGRWLQRLVLALCILSRGVVADAAILLESKSGGAAIQLPSLSAAATDARAAGGTVRVTSALSAVMSNISSATLHAWPADRTLRVEKGGSIGNTTLFRFAPGATVDLPETHVFAGAGNVRGLFAWRPEWFGAKTDDSTDCTTAMNAAAAAAGSAGLVKLSSGTYRITATSPNYAVTFYGSVVGEGPKTTIIKNTGTGHAVKIIGDSDSSGTWYYSRLSGFSIVGNALSGNGLSLNSDADTTDTDRVPAYGQFNTIYVTDHGGHGLVHQQAWATDYTDCKFSYNGGLGVYLASGTESTEHNNITFTNCESRWNGGEGNASADFTKGGVRISGTGSGVFWNGGVVESNNAWNFIIGEDANNSVGKVVIAETYSEGSPPDAATSATGGFMRLSTRYSDVTVRDSYIAYGATTAKTGYAFYLNNPAFAAPGFTEKDNTIVWDNRLGSAVRDSGLDYGVKWGSTAEVIDRQVNRDFSATPNDWTNGTMSGYDEGDTLTLVANATGQYAYLPKSAINGGVGFVYGKRYGIRYTSSGSGPIYFASAAKKVRLGNIGNTTGHADEFVWSEDDANQSLFVYADGAATADIDNISIYEIGAGNQPKGLLDGLLSETTVAFNANADTALFTVPTGKRCVLTHAVVVAGADAGATTTISIGAEASTYADFLATNTLSNLDAQYDAVTLRPIPNTTPLKSKSYSAGAVIYAHIANQSGGTGNTIYLYGMVY